MKFKHGEKKQKDVPKKAPKIEKQKYKPKFVKDSAENTMKQSKFRYLNELLYTQPSNEGDGAVTMFMKEPAQFTDYHEGYRQQV